MHSSASEVQCAVILSADACIQQAPDLQLNPRDAFIRFIYVVRSETGAVPQGDNARLTAAFFDETRQILLRRLGPTPRRPPQGRFQSAVFSCWRKPHIRHTSSHRRERRSQPHELCVLVTRPIDRLPRPLRPDSRSYARPCRSYQPNDNNRSGCRARIRASRATAAKVGFTGAAFFHAEVPRSEAVVISDMPERSAHSRLSTRRTPSYWEVMGTQGPGLEVAVLAGGETGFARRWAFPHRYQP